ncbi:MAG: HAMP domain-containing histidine kinase, partial [Sedimenticola sp.]|nr:HAMP domain-containing histidine kinase [Sedimenticola sp.]MCW8948244.1 HAMP domain-containing histidine kinase [Sedimenticola sp.]MCW9021721.1 HAMP domain-containing histidine kinase [Sedimenticola sp.]
RHIESQINDMLAFAKGGQFELAPLSLQELIIELQHGLETLCVEQNGVIETRFDVVNDLIINGNQAALLGALMNLAVNAIQQAGPIHLLITLQQKENALQINFKDDGPGIPKEHQSCIFDPFYTTRPDGTGLGLAVVQSVILAHQGKLAVKSLPGEGACFSIVLPLPEQTATENEFAVRSTA